MEYDIGSKIQAARLEKNMTQEQVAGLLEVSRQTISNRENAKSYPDIVSVIKMSECYNVSLDYLLKGKEPMNHYYEYLEESTNVVKSNKKLLGAVVINIVMMVLLITLSMFVPEKTYYLAGVFCIMIIGAAVLLYEIIKRI